MQKLIPKIPKEWDTGELAKALSIPRWEAQKVAYVLRKTGTAKEVGKRGNAIVCRFTTTKEASAELKVKKTKRKSISEIRSVVAAHQERLRKSAKTRKRAANKSA